MILAVIEDFGHSMSRQEPYPCVLESASIPCGLQQRSILIAKPKTIAIEKFDRIEKFSGGFVSLTLKNPLLERTKNRSK